MKSYKATQNNSVMGPLFPATEASYAFGLIRHTKENPNRLYTYMRTGSTWIGSRENYDARIKRRWPIRFFLAKGFAQKFWEPIKRIPLDIQCAKHLRLLSPQQVAFEEAIHNITGGRSLSRGEIFDRLTAALPDDPDLVRRVDVTVGLSRNDVFELKSMYEKGMWKLVPRPGMGTKDISQYPEADDLRNITDALDALKTHIGKIAIELARSSSKVKLAVECQVS